MYGIYEAFFTALSSDAQLQTLLGGTATDKKVYPVYNPGKSNLPSIRVAIYGGGSDVALGVDRPIVDVLIVSKNGAAEMNTIGNRVDVVLNRKRLSGPNGTVLHLSHKVTEQDIYDDTSLEYRRVIRYSVIKT
jgi:hypothetical protein